MYDPKKVRELIAKASPLPWKRSTDRDDDVVLWAGDPPDGGEAPFIGNLAGGRVGPVVENETPRSVIFDLDAHNADLIEYVVNTAGEAAEIVSDLAIEMHKLRVQNADDRLRAREEAAAERESARAKNQRIAELEERLRIRDNALVDAEDRLTSLRGTLDKEIKRGIESENARWELTKELTEKNKRVDERQAAIELLGSAIGRCIPEARATGTGCEHAESIARQLDEWRIRRNAEFTQLAKEGKEASQAAMRYCREKAEAEKTIVHQSDLLSRQQVKISELWERIDRQEKELDARTKSQLETENAVRSAIATMRNARVELPEGDYQLEEELLGLVETMRQMALCMKEHDDPFEIDAMEDEQREFVRSVRTMIGVDSCDLSLGNLLSDLEKLTAQWAKFHEEEVPRAHATNAVVSLLRKVTNLPGPPINVSDYAFLCGQAWRALRIYDGMPVPPDPRDRRVDPESKES